MNEVVHCRMAQFEYQSVSSYSERANKFVHLHITQQVSYYLRAGVCGHNQVSSHVHTIT